MVLRFVLDSLVRGQSVLDSSSGFPRLLLFVVLLLLVLCALAVGERRPSRGRRAAGPRRPDPASVLRLWDAVLGRRPGQRRLQRVDAFLHAALSRSAAATPRLRLFIAVLLILSPAVQVVVEGNDVGDFLPPPSLLPQPRVWAETKTRNSNLKKLLFSLKTAD